jgi:hypothetical protein
VPSSFVVYVDESGDEGFVFNEDRSGSSRWFVLAAVVVPTAIELETVKLVDRLRALLSWDRKSLHFRKMLHEMRVPYVALIAEANLRVAIVAVHKPSIGNREALKGRSLLYHWAVTRLLSEVSKCCRNMFNGVCGDGTAEIVFSKRAGTPCLPLQAHIRAIAAQPSSVDFSIDWAIIKPEQIVTIEHDDRMGLQIADACASSFYYGLQANRFGFNEPRYATILTPVVSGSQGASLFEAIAIIPDAARKVCQMHCELAWLWTAR